MLGCLWDHSEMTVGSFWDLFGITFGRLGFLALRHVGVLALRNAFETPISTGLHFLFGVRVKKYQDFRNENHLSYRKQPTIIW